MNTASQTTLYIGLNDRNTGEQKYSTEKYLSLLKAVCRSYHTPFSVTRIQGGYFHEDGRYVEEETLVLMMVDVRQETIEEIAKDLCVFFNQENIMITEGTCRVRFLQERLENEEAHE